MFVSYSHRREDAERAEVLARYLEANGIRCWLDRSDLVAGKPFDRAISSGLRQCFALLWVASKRSSESDYVQRELSMALLLDCPIVPVMLEPIDWRGLAGPFSDARMQVHGIPYYEEPRESRLNELTRSLQHLAQEYEERERRKSRRSTLRKFLVVFGILLAALAGWMISNREGEPPRDRFGTLPSGAVLGLLAGDSPFGQQTPKELSLQLEVHSRKDSHAEFRSVRDGDTLISAQDEYVILTRPLTDGYLYVFQVDATGRAQWLFPQNPTCGMSGGRNPVRGGSLICSPPATRRTVFQLDRNTGVEHVYAVFCPEPWPELEKHLAAPLPGDLAAVTVPGRFMLTRGIAGEHPIDPPGGIGESPHLELTLDGVPQRLGLSSRPLAADRNLLIVERWFKHE